MTAAAGLKEPMITVMASGESGSLFEAEKACADQDIIMAGYTGGYGAAKLTFANEAELENHFNSVFLSPILEADYTGDAISTVKAVETAAAAGVRTMYACGEGGVYSAVWELTENAGLGARNQEAELAAAGIPAVIIGHLTDDNDRVVLNEEEVRFLEPFRYESLNQAKSES